MIREYALEPELVALWHQRLLGRFFIEQFGFGTGRVVSRYPKKWKTLVWDAFLAAAAAGEIERKRIEELLVRLTTPEVRRLGWLWDESQDWLTNAESEHARKPFFAILARDNPRTNAAVICADDVIAGTPPAWPAPNCVVVTRIAGSMADCILQMLRCAKKILFVDPHFRAIRPEFNRPLTAFLKIVADSGMRATVELHPCGR